MLSGESGYVIETDWRPNRVELVAPGRGWVDVHPLVFEGRGDGYELREVDLHDLAVLEQVETD